MLSVLVFAAPAAFGQEHSANMEHVNTLGYELRNGGTTPHGTDIEFTRIGAPVRAGRLLLERHADR